MAFAGSKPQCGGKDKGTKRCTAQARRFGTVAASANKVCHAETNSVLTYKSCMRREMKAGLGGRKRKAGGRRKRR